MRKSLVFVSVTPFPNGQAATNRIISLLKHTPSLGWETEVICTSSVKFPTKIENNTQSYERTGEYEGVKFRYLSLNVKRERFLIQRILSRLFGWIRVPLVLARNRKSETPILLTDLTQFYYILYLKLISLILSYKLILIRSEYPFIRIKNKFLLIAYQKLIEGWIFKFFDGFVLMTYALEEYFSKIKSGSSVIRIVPMTVEMNRFSQKKDSPFDFEYIAYAGSLSNEKDGVDTLIKAFSLISDDQPELRLVIIGDNSKSRVFNQLLSLIDNLSESVRRRIVFTGRIDSGVIPCFLLNARILTLARPDSVQAQGGFPTKLGEYLATGNPVVVTSVGEIPIYLKNKFSAIFCEPGNTNSFAEGMLWALKNYDEAKMIGMNGREVAARVFCSKVQAENFSEFLSRL